MIHLMRFRYIPLLLLVLPLLEIAGFVLVGRQIGVLPTLLLKKETYRSMAGGDGACMGCGEKTAVHLIVSSIEGRSGLVGSLNQAIWS